MTLMEPLVGRVITSLMLAGGYAALPSMVDHREIGTQSLDGVSRAASVRRTLTAWLGGAILRADGTGPAFRGVDGIDAGQDDDELALLAGTRLGPEWDEWRVRPFVDRDDETPERGVVAEVGPPAGSEGERVELAPGATAPLRKLAAARRQAVSAIPR